MVVGDSRKYRAPWSDTERGGHNTAVVNIPEVKYPALWSNGLSVSNVKITLIYLQRSAWHSVREILIRLRGYGFPEMGTKGQRITLPRKHNNISRTGGYFYY